MWDLTPLQPVHLRGIYILKTGQTTWDWTTSLEARGYIPSGIPGFSKTSAPPKTKNFADIAKDKITIAIPSELENANDMKAFFEEQFKSHGWNVLVVPTPWNDLMKAYKEKTLQGFLVSKNMDYPDAEFLLRNFESNNPDNFSGISDKKIDQKLKEARNIQDRAQRQGVYQEVAKRINELALTINLFHPRVSYWLDTCVRGFEPNYLSAVYIDYRPVEIDRDCAQKQRRRN